MYTQSITRSHRTAFILAIDQSGSMAEKLLFRGRQTTKAEAVAESPTGCCSNSSNGPGAATRVRDYYDIAVLGYSGDGIVSLLNDPERWFRYRGWPLCPSISQKRSWSAACRTAKPPSARFRCGLDRSESGRTDTHVRSAAANPRPDTSVVHESGPQRSFPPIVFNITDGGSLRTATSANSSRSAKKIRTIGTTDGKVLLINIHIATTSDSRSLLFPTEEEIPADNRYARLLHDCSSPMPEELSEAIRQVRGDLAKPPFRGMSYNTSIAELIAILNIGSISIKIQ